MEKMEMKPGKDMLSAIRGCLIGGAAGDALGYPVEFCSRDDILWRYGKNGIQDYDTDYESGFALISDDTQMTLFTANGLLNALAAGDADAPEKHIFRAYVDWYHCQKRLRLPDDNRSWISDIPEMHFRRAPGNSCMSALGSGEMGTMETPINGSKGCGGVMRAAPIALLYGSCAELSEADRIGAKAAAITHGHPLGYIPAAALVHIISRAACGGCEGDLYSIAEECCDTLKRLFPDENQLEDMLGIMKRAMELSRNDAPDAANIKALGDGWTGEEALAIALYCCLKYQDDFSRAIIAAVNHSGDSDSTGAIAGNIMGALLGMEAIDEKWLRLLECKKLILKMADDLCAGARMYKENVRPDAEWERRYGRTDQKQI